MDICQILIQDEEDAFIAQVKVKKTAFVICCAYDALLGLIKERDCFSKRHMSITVNVVFLIIKQYFLCKSCLCSRFIIRTEMSKNNIFIA